LPQVLLTVGLIVAVAVWFFAALRRLAVMRTEVKLAWMKLETDQSNDAIKNVYNKHVSTYNAALENFPANVIGPLAGFKPARHF
jgi:hypothetical protein